MKGTLDRAIETICSEDLTIVSGLVEDAMASVECGRTARDRLEG
jgi:hypothetical protein